MRSGLTWRVVIVSATIACLSSAAFIVLLLAIGDQRDSARLSRHSQEVLATANQVERLLIDAETGARGYLLTGEERFLDPLRAAETAFPGASGQLSALTSDPEQDSRAREIGRLGAGYLNDYINPLVDAARRGDPTARSVGRQEQGKATLDEIRTQFTGLEARERAIGAQRDDRARENAQQAVVAAVAWLVVAILLLVFVTGYLNRAFVRPIRHAAGMAQRLAAGDLTVRMPETGAGEIGVLEQAFNTMAGSLERSQGELTASRARVVTATDQIRRRIERDLHDGTQQRLVSLTLDLRNAQADVPDTEPGLRAELGAIADGLVAALDDLREVSRGIHPALLSRGGLGPALKALARRSAVPVEVDVAFDARLPDAVEVAAYYVVAEALTNAAKHAQATVVQVVAVIEGGALRLTVRDDGLGGADPARGSGLIGLTDRVAALGGTIAVTSRPGAGTTLHTRLPLPVEPDAGSSI